MRKFIDLTTKLRWAMLLACLAWIWPQASADVTVFVQASSAPKLYVFNTSGTCSATASGTAFSSYTTWSGVTMSKSVTTSDNKTWYYEVFTGLNSCSIILNNGSSQTDDITGVSGTKYYYFNGTNKYIDLTGCKTASAYCFLETSTSYWEQASARFQVWDGSADVWMTQVGSVRSGGKIYLYTKSSAVTDGNTFYFKRMSSDGNSKWNEGSAPYHKGGYYTNTGWSNVSYQSGSSFGTIVWPTIPAATTYTYTVYVYDNTGAPRVGGTTLSTTESGTNCTWYKYAYSSTTAPSAVTVADHSGSHTASLTPSNGGTYYYAYNGYTVETVTSDYDPAVRHLVYWPGSGNYANNKTDVTLTTTDGINYTATGITLSEATYFIFATSVPSSWNNATFYTSNSGDKTFDGTTATETAVHGGNNAYKLTNAGIWSFSYNIITNVWTATRTGDIPTNSFTIHVIEYQEGVPYLYAWSGSSTALNGAFPGAQMTTTETSAVGETWYVKTFTSPAATINAIASLGDGNSQTSDIAGIAPGDYYIVFDGSTKAIKYQGTTMPEGKQQKQKNTFTVYVMADDAPHVYFWNDNNQYIGSQWPGVEMSNTEQLADGNTWWKIEVETWDNDVNLLFHDGEGHQTGDIKQTAAVGYYVYNGSTNAIQTVEPTGNLYVIGQVGGNPWAANSGLKMTAASDGTTFTLNNVQIISGATFAFATALGSDEDDWTGLQHYRLVTNADGDIWEVTSAQTDKDDPTAIGLHAWSGADKTLKMDETAFYDITVDMKAMTATITRRYNALYMFYGDSESPYWKPNAGVPMLTTDGISYMLSNVTLGDGDTFQFATQLATTDTGWNEIAAYRYGAAAQGSYWEVTAEEIGITLENALLAGSTKNFQMDPGTAGTYRVVVNPTAGTVALYRMAEVLGSKVILHLEQNANVTAPKLWAYDKERNKENTAYIHEDRPSRDVIASARRVFYENAAPTGDEITTADGRKWWTWEVDNSIVDFWFTRGDYTFNGTDLTNADMTDIQWRKSGELYLTWPAEGTALDEYTRDYYAAAAQEAADCAVMLEGHEYAYFTNTPGWAHVFCHAWYTDAQGINHDLLTPPAPYSGDPCYPGALCELVGYDKDGYEVWRIDLTAAGVTQYPNGGILFNNGIDDNHNYQYEGNLNHDYATGEGTTAAKEQSGDFVYRTGTCYDYCGVIVLGRSLSNIVVKGIVDGPVYTIEEDLVGVYFDPNAITTIEVDGETYDFCGALYCKDLNNFVSTPNVEKSLQKEDQIDYLKIYYDGDTPVPDRYDQSNWVKLTLSSQYPGYEAVRHSVAGQLALLSQYVGKVLPAESVKGQLVNNYNPEMRLALQELPAVNQCKTNIYNPNVFVMPNFLDAQSQKTDENGNTFNFFVVNPKPQEYAHITWAVYGGNDQFFVPTKMVYSITETGRRWWVNEFDLDGYFPVSWDIMVDAPNLTVGECYDFFAIIRLAEESDGGNSGASGAPRRVDGNVSVPYKTNVTESRYVVSPVDISSDNIITGVRDVTAPAIKHIKQVRYISPLGQESSTPFEGVNIVVTRYDDGSQQSHKVVY